MLRSLFLKWLFLEYHSTTEMSCLSLTSQDSIEKWFDRARHSFPHARSSIKTKEKKRKDQIVLSRGHNSAVQIIKLSVLLISRLYISIINKKKRGLQTSCSYINASFLCCCLLLFSMITKQLWEYWLFILLVCSRVG